SRSFSFRQSSSSNSRYSSELFASYCMLYSLSYIFQFYCYYSLNEIYFLFIEVNACLTIWPVSGVNFLQSHYKQIILYTHIDFVYHLSDTNISYSIYSKILLSNIKLLRYIINFYNIFKKDHGHFLYNRPLLFLLFTIFDNICDLTRMHSGMIHKPTNSF